MNGNRAAIGHVYDLPEDDSKLLHADTFRDRIGQLISQYLKRVGLDNQPGLPGQSAFVVGIHGPWGCGKTTLMRMIGKKLADDRRALGLSPLITVAFQAWKFDQREVLWRALLSRVVAQVEEQTAGRDDFDRKARTELARRCAALREALYRDYEQSVGRRWGLKLPPLDELAEAALDLKVGSAIKTAAKAVERTEIKQFHARIEAFDQFEDEFLALRQASKSPWLVLVDDLDRCLPESAIDVFEAIKVFLDAPGVVFILALDKRTIRTGLRARYQDKPGERPLVDPEEYIEKVTNISFVVPTLPIGEVESFLKALCARESGRADSDDPQLVEELLKVLRTSEGPGVQPNPRRWIRLLNTAFLYDDLLRALGGKRDEKFVKLLLLSYRWGGFMEAVLESWEVLATFERAAQQAERDFAAFQRLCNAKYPDLKLFAEDPDLYRLLRSSPPVADFPAADLVRKLFV
jgi:hypothetical protein